MTIFALLLLISVTFTINAEDIPEREKDTLSMPRLF